MSCHSSARVPFEVVSCRMPLPAAQEFEGLLSSLTLREPADHAGWDSIELVAPRVQVEGNRQWLTEPTIAWARRTGNLTLTALVERLTKELGQRGHPSSEGLAGIILAIGVHLPQSGSAVQAFNGLLDLIVPVDCTRYLIAPFPSPPSSVPFKVGRFRVGLLDLERLRYWCTKVGCDYFRRYPGAFANCLAIEGDHVPVLALDMRQLKSNAEARGLSVPPQLLDNYFNLLTDSMRASFEQEFVATQEVFVAAGAPYIDVSDVRTILDSHFIAIYDCKKGATKWGYFCPLGIAARLDWGRVDEQIPRTIEMLKTRFGFEDFGNAEIFTSIRTFSRFVTRAYVHEAHGRRDEAFLHRVVALDLLFGTDGENTRTVCSRTAAVFAVSGSQPFADTLKLVKALYDARSRYVHAGKSVSSQDMDDLKPVLKVVFETLMRLQGRPKSQEDGFVARWCKDLDYVASALEAGRELPAADLAELGLGTSGGIA